ncbi:TPA: YidC/Oxa1 family membrane protein insertase, partial [Candidatus Gracilibacteria bacterium]|nr:YidC/Oxa1 family membrane protein insertase [Candidatus Gracilibacteria bacterium]
GVLELLKTPLEYLPAIWLPVVVAIAQYFAMKLSFAKMKQQQDAKKKDKNYKKPEGFMGEMQGEMQKMSGVFVYVLPVMILFFTMFLPLAVGVYWLISTLFSIGQQYAVNKMVDKEVS